MHRLWLATLLIAIVALAADRARAAEEGEPDLAADVLPLFKAHCVKCHGPAKREGKLQLQHASRHRPRAARMAGRLSAEKLDASLLWQRVEADEMPPDEPLAAAEKETLKRWIAGGAKGLPKVEPDAAAGSDHWAFAPLVEQPLPEVRDASARRTAVDRFIAGSARSPRIWRSTRQADRTTLIRRVSFDLTGLPPTPEEIGAFLDDTSADAYERMVDRYLASPHYGERWGKYWLDAAGYADSNGYFNADTDRPLAYRYRDYVVRSLNDDKPFDRFVRRATGRRRTVGLCQPGTTPRRKSSRCWKPRTICATARTAPAKATATPTKCAIDRYAALEVDRCRSWPRRCWA